ncbi:MAG: acylphosphatase [Candidatus Levybacteria bacterium]|nr:acylphosphatase [Candidatus Levybacteria bacterium]
MKKVHFPAKAESVQVHFFILGFVQGVGFRQFVKTQADRLRLTGWVRNLSDGQVEVVSQGEKTAIESLVALCKKGPILAEVKKIEVLWEEPNQEYSSFDIH